MRCTIVSQDVPPIFAEQVPRTFYAKHYIGDNNMIKRLFRLISTVRRRNDSYATVSVPKSVYDFWNSKGCHNVKIEYDTDADSLTVTPV